MLRAALILTIIGLLALPALAPADATFPGQRQTTDSRIQEEVDLAVSFWQDRNVTGCGDGITAYYAASLVGPDTDLHAGASARGGGCRIYLLRAYLKMLRNPRDSKALRRESVGEECFLVFHEVGHALGLQHTHDGGVMDPDRHGIPYDCRTYARSLYVRAR